MTGEDWGTVLDALAAGDFAHSRAYYRIYMRHPLGRGDQEYTRLMSIQDATKLRFLCRIVHK